LISLSSCCWKDKEQAFGYGRRNFGKENQEASKFWDDNGFSLLGSQIWFLFPSYLCDLWAWLQEKKFFDELLEATKV
jgi:hypothetical protein